MNKATQIIILSFAFLLGMTVVTSCGNRKPTPEEEVRDFGRYFIEKLSANQLDSLKGAYPDIVKADSVVTIKSDTIIVARTAPGEYDMILMPGVSLKVNRSETGVITVKESKGLFAYPADKLEFARITGLWDDNLTDAMLADRFKDEGFPIYLEQRKAEKIKNAITIGQLDTIPNMEDDPTWCEFYRGYYPLINTSGEPFLAADYNIIWNLKTPEGPEEGLTVVKPGKDIQPGDTLRIDWHVAGQNTLELIDIQFNIPEEELAAKFDKYNGTEFKEYLQSKTSSK